MWLLLDNLLLGARVHLRRLRCSVGIRRYHGEPIIALLLRFDDDSFARTRWPSTCCCTTANSCAQHTCFPGCLCESTLLKLALYEPDSLLPEAQDRKVRRYFAFLLVCSLKGVLRISKSLPRPLTFTRGALQHDRCRSSLLDFVGCAQDARERFPVAVSSRLFFFLHHRQLPQPRRFRHLMALHAPQASSEASLNGGRSLFTLGRDRIGVHCPSKRSREHRSARLPDFVKDHLPRRLKHVLILQQQLLTYLQLLRVGRQSLWRRGLPEPVRFTGQLQISSDAMFGALRQAHLQLEVFKVHAQLTNMPCGLTGVDLP
jgi:hypothetical protein